jgi:hypothetical protein
LRAGVLSRFSSSADLLEHELHAESFLRIPAISLAAIARQLDALTLLRGPIIADMGTAGHQVALTLLGFNVSFV